MSCETLPFRETTRIGDLHKTFEVKKDAWRDCKKALSLGVSVALNSIASGKEEINPNKKVYFITSRKAKFDEVSQLLMGLNIEQASFGIPTLERTDNLIQVAVYRVLKAFRELRKRGLQGSCFIEETALEIKDIPYKNYPGRLFKDIAEDKMGKKEFARTFHNKPATAECVFAYTADGQKVHVFNGEVSGRIMDPQENWVEGDGWDPFFVIKGFTKPLSVMKSEKHLVYMRQNPCAEMRSVIQEKDYPGVYEVHITVANAMENQIKLNGNQNFLKPSEEYLSNFKEVCEELGLKALVIGMDKPEKPMQLQTAIYKVYKDYKEGQEDVFKCAQEFIKRGFKVLRVRLEAMLHNEESPKTDEEARKCPKSNYFEFHARLAEVTPDRVDLFKTIIYSWGKREIGKDEQGLMKAKFSTVGGGARYFANARIYNVGSSTALIHWNSMIEELQVNGFKIAKFVKPEYCIYDGDPRLDKMKIRE